MAFLPTPEEMSSFETVGDIAGWLEVEGDLLDALTKAVGAKTLTLRTWARIPAARWSTLVSTLKVTTDLGHERPLSPIEEGQVGDLQAILATLAAGRHTPAPK